MIAKPAVFVLIVCAVVAMGAAAKAVGWLPLAMPGLGLTPCGALQLDYSVATGCNAVGVVLFRN